MAHASTSRLRGRFDRAVQYIDNNLATQIRLEDLANAAAMSPYHFCRSFKREMGMSPMRFILARRVQAATAMLERGELMLADIAYQCGFASQSHMCTSFKTVTGKTPSACRKQITES